MHHYIITVQSDPENIFLSFLAVHQNIYDVFQQPATKSKNLQHYNFPFTNTPYAIMQTTYQDFCALMATDIKM